MPISPRRSAPAIVASVLLTTLAVGCSATPPPNPPSSPSSATPTPPKPSPTKPAAPKATDPLTGQKVSKNPVLAVKIENTQAARPQVGLAEADLVVVEEVEAGITRLIGIYHQRFPTTVGPVRSARNTDVRLLPMFGRPGLVYSGANGRVQEQIRQSSVIAIERNDRDNSRAAPHNVMVDLSSLADTAGLKPAKSIGFTFAAKDPARAAADKATPEATVGADTFTFPRKGDSYIPHWRGQPYAGKVQADNVVILEVANRADTQTTANSSIVSETVGKGKVAVHRNGTVRNGQWQRPKLGGPMRLTADGKNIPLAPGQTWIVLKGR